MKKTFHVMGSCLMLMAFVASTAEADFRDRTIPKRIREEMKTKEEKERVQKIAEMTPEQEAKRKERIERMRARVNKYLVNPIKKLRPRRHPELYQKETKEEAAARRKERMRERFGGLVPHRYQKDRTIDTVEDPGPPPEVKPATYSAEEIK